MPTIKKYLLFAGDRYYPLRGVDNFVDSFSSILEAIRYVANLDVDWYQIADRETMQEVESGDKT